MLFGKLIRGVEYMKEGRRKGLSKPPSVYARRASISILAGADIVAVRVVAVVGAVSAVGAVGRGTNRCGAHRRRTVSATWIIPSPVTRATRDAVPTAHATGMDGSTS